MNLTNFELSQALVEAIGALTCLISAGVLLFRGMNRTTKELKNMFIILAVMLVCDGSAYLFRGNTEPVFIILTRIGNYGNFLMNCFLMISSSRLIQATKEGNTSDKAGGITTYMKVIFGISGADALILVVNMFTGIMFYFDESNYYHRNTFWYVYTAFMLIGGLVSVFYIVYYRKKLGTPLAVTLIIYEFSPLILTAIQAVYYGISIAVIGIAISIIIVMYTYFFSVEAVRFTTSDKGNKLANYPLWIYTAIILLIVSMSVAFITCINSFGRALTKLGVAEDGFYILKNIWPSLVIFFAGVIILLLLFIIMFGKEWRSRQQSEENRLASIRDELTGALNRRAYERAIEADLSADADSNEFAVVMLDINGLKAANDSLGHDAGDRLVIGAAKCITTAFGGYGNIYRIGGDEFAALIYCSEEQQTAIFADLEKLCAGWRDPQIKELSVSKGCIRAADHPGKSIEELVKMADQLMYADKDVYYQRTGKKRREY